MTTNKSLDEILKMETIDDHYDENLVKLVRSNHHRDTPRVHYWFNGQPGTGKTTFAHCLAKYILSSSFEYDFFEYNSSHDRGIDFVKDTLFKLSRGPNVILLDEADGLTRDAQDALRRLMETGEATFILTSNSSHKISPALKDRMVACEFKGPPKKWLWEKLKDNPEVNQEHLKTALKLSKNSFRDIKKNYSSLVSTGLTEKVDNDELLKMTKKDFIDYSWTADVTVLITRLHKEIIEYKSIHKELALIELSEIDFRCSLSTTKSLQIQTGFLKILKILDIK